MKSAAGASAMKRGGEIVLGVKAAKINENLAKYGLAGARGGGDVAGARLPASDT